MELGSRLGEETAMTRLYELICLPNPVKCLILLCVLSTFAANCRSQYDPYDEFQFKEVVLCRGLDEHGIPIGKTESIASDTQGIGVCIYLETHRRVTFVVQWLGPTFSGLHMNTPVTAQREGWLSVWLESGEDGLPPGEHTVTIFVGKTIKMAKTFEVVEE
jgi:hypothetical protein